MKAGFMQFVCRIEVLGVSQRRPEILEVEGC